MRAVLVAYDVPDTPPPGKLRRDALPADWATYPFSKATQDIGTEWVRGRVELALRVPSAIVPHEMNWLLNPRHPAVAKVKSDRAGAVFLRWAPPLRIRRETADCGRRRGANWPTVGPKVDALFAGGRLICKLNVP